MSHGEGREEREEGREEGEEEREKGREGSKGDAKVVLVVVREGSQATGREEKGGGGEGGLEGDGEKGIESQVEGGGGGGGGGGDIMQGAWWGFVGEWTLWGNELNLFYLTSPHSPG